MTIFQNKDVEHSFYCCSVTCLLDNKEQRHVSVFHFDTAKKSYLAETLNDAAKMWAADGQQELIDVGRVG